MIAGYEKDNKKRALVAMSGGVDSSVSAALMQAAGYDCIGVTMKLYANEQILPEQAWPEPGKTCCTADDALDARSVCLKMGMQHYTFDLSEDFARDVIGDFIDNYERGRTPNPCIECNRCLKFGKLWERAKELDADVIATGHYARTEYDPERGRWLLKRPADLAKDQTYVLYMLTQEQLAHTVFPLGGMTKEEVRAFAAERGFVNSEKRESQDICFVPDGDYAAFMERYTGKEYPPGDFIDTEGRVLGRHRGAVRYTLGQRKGLGLAMGEPVYVCAKDMAANTVTVGPEERLFERELLADRVNWIGREAPAPGETLRLEACTRYHQKVRPAEASLTEDGLLKVVFDEPQRAVTPGQAVVLYDGDLVIGGGTILKAREAPGK
ncbi:MAG: tRNA 2-thiouridine(34) synthase MnmA [Lachnospiraceae bacterium]|nr:tRNA 2-thiouridine(34) synthase MnmA [Lachnospiraceae bacterium]